MKISLPAIVLFLLVACSPGAPNIRRNISNQAEFTLTPIVPPSVVEEVEVTRVVTEATKVVHSGWISDLAIFRAGPGREYEFVAYLKKGEKVEVLGRSDDGSWFNVISDSGIRGWVSSSVVRLRELETPKEVPTAATIPAKPRPSSPTPSTIPTKKLTPPTQKS